MSQTTEIKIHYGALANPIEEQLNEQGFTLGKELEFIEKLQYSLTYCRFHLLTDAQYQSCLKKFHKKVMDKIKLIEIKE